MQYGILTNTETCIIMQNMKRPELTDFGGWVQSIIDKSDNFTVSDLSRETGIPYPSLDRILKSGRRGKVVRPGEETIDAISQALLKAELIDDINEAWAAAGFIVEGYQIAKKDTEGQSVSPQSKDSVMPIEYEPILDELRSASYDGGLGSGDVDEITEIIRMKARRRAERQGRA